MKSSMHDPTVFVAATGDSSRLELIRRMPSNVREKLARCSNNSDQECLRKVVRDIVRRTSRSQSIKGIFTAGGIKSVQYVLQKINRAYFSRSGWMTASPISALDGNPQVVGFATSTRPLTWWRPVDDDLLVGPRDWYDVEATKMLILVTLTLSFITRCALREDSKSDQKACLMAR